MLSELNLADKALSAVSFVLHRPVGTRTAPARTCSSIPPVGEAGCGSSSEDEAVNSDSAPPRSSPAPRLRELGPTIPAGNLRDPVWRSVEGFL